VQCAGQRVGAVVEQAEPTGVHVLKGAFFCSELGWEWGAGAAAVSVRDWLCVCGALGGELAQCLSTSGHCCGVCAGGAVCVQCAGPRVGTAVYIKGIAGVCVLERLMCVYSLLDAEWARWLKASRECRGVCV
jgi:hypothetical protein